MANGGGGGGSVITASPRAQRPSGGGARSESDAAWLPLDIIVSEIAARSDASTLVRCAATCRDARRRVAQDPRRLLGRLRDTGVFLPPLLRGHLVGFTTVKGWRTKTNVYLVDTTTAADATRVVEATFASDAAEAEALMDPVAMDSRGGLVLIRATASAPLLPPHTTLLVCNPATGRRLVLPPEPEPFPNGGCCNRQQYVLLVGDRDDGAGGAGAGAAFGRPFQVLKLKLILSRHNNPCYHRLLVQTFSSEDGSWSPRTEIPTPNIHGRWIACCQSLQTVLVVGDVVHRLCLTDVGSYVLTLHVSREALQVSETALPATFPRYNKTGGRSCLLATDSAGGSPVVLVADAENNIRLWEQCKGSKSKMMWKAWPRVVIGREAILGFNDEVKEAVQRCNDEVARRWAAESKRALELLWFGERSGVVLLRTHGCCLLWLNLHSKKIIRCYCSDHRMSFALVYCPYEMDVSSWTPTFSSVVTI